MKPGKKQSDGEEGKRAACRAGPGHRPRVACPPSRCPTWTVLARQPVLPGFLAALPRASTSGFPGTVMWPWQRGGGGQGALQWWLQERHKGGKHQEGSPGPQSPAPGEGKHVKAAFRRTFTHVSSSLT